MAGVYLPGDRQVEFRQVPVPEPGHGQVLIEMKASSICGSDLRAIYREDLGEGPEAYQNVIAGHEPCGRIAQVGPGWGPAASASLQATGSWLTTSAAATYAAIAAKGT